MPSPRHLLDAWTTYYIWAHESWAPVISAETVRRVLADKQLPHLDLTASVAALTEDERIAGLGLVAKEVWDGRTFAICATTHHDEPDGERVTAAVIAGVLRALGDQRVEFEGHDCDPHISVIRSLPAAGADPMVVLTTAD